MTESARNTLSSKPVLRVLDGEAVWPPPVWIMRQAGRYLPEYRALRAKAGSFLDLCYDPALAAEVTLQPIRRFGFDAAILFSDILVVPDALGVEVRFVEGEGPRLAPVASMRDLDRLALALPLDRLSPVFETLGQVKTALPDAVALLGFCGAPWTVASYMVAGRGTPDQAPGLDAARTQPDFMTRLIELLVDSSIAYLSAQIEAGADAVQIFESHAGALPADLVEPLSIGPIARIVAALRERHPAVRVIVFPRGRGDRLGDYAGAGVAAIGIDQHQDLATALARLPAGVAGQGNLDPDLLISGGPALDRGIDALLATIRGRPHIVNLGHGITPPTPVEHVAQMLARVRAA